MHFLSTKSRTTPLLNLWDSIVSTILEKDISSKGVYRQDNFYMDLKGFYSGDNLVTYMYTIDGYPSQLPISMRSLLRKECKGDTRVSFVTDFEKTKIKWKSAQTKSKINIWRTLDSKAEEVDEYNYNANAELLEGQERKKTSLVYFSDAEQKRGRRTFKIRTAMFVAGSRGDDFDNTIKDVIALGEDLGLKINRVMFNIKDYLEMFSPFSCRFNDIAEKNTGYITLTDEIASRLSTYSQGTVGVRGMYWATDIESGFPCMKVPKPTDVSLENWLISAESSGGKSYLAKNLILQLLGFKRFRGTIMDIEGFEYIELAEYVGRYSDTLLLNVGEGTGAYFDPVEIILTGNKQLDMDMYSVSSSYTKAILRALLGSISDNNWVDISIGEAVRNTYVDNGVLVSDMSTWLNSTGLSLYDVYRKFREITPRNNEHKLALDMAIAKLEESFGLEEGDSTRFIKRITIEDIATAKLVVCSFGLAGKTEDSIDPVSMTLMQLTASIISHLRSVFSKNDGCFNFKVWEEFQRWGKFKGSKSTVGTALTGGRKLGDLNMIITNEVSKLLADDTFSIFQNVSTIAIGAIGDAKVREDLCTRLAIPNMLPELDRIATENTQKDEYADGDDSLANKYRKAFLIGLDRTAYTIARVSLPKAYADSEIFKTGVSEKVS